jgi:hypothetical protein
MKTKLLLLTAIALGLFASFAASGTPQNLVLILDASNSMNKPFASDTRIAAARSALDNLLTRMPEQGNVGLMAFGHRINYQNEVESCQDITFLFPLAPYTVAIGQQMIGAVAQVKPQGKTPLADALTVAANSLAGLGQGGTIVLLSDGEGNCGGQEAVVAQMLATMQPPIVLHVIGLDVDAQASESLRAMALETGGSYWDVSDSASLADALFAAISTAPAEAAATPAAADGIPPEYAALAARLGFKIDNVVYGTESDDVIYGTPGNDLIFGLGGNDFIISLGGNDILVGGPGRDILEGGEGNDVLMGGEGDDLLFGGGGDDIVCGGPGNDSLEGEAGNDILDGGEGCDTLLGGTGQNLLYCADGLDTLFQGTAVYGTYGVCADGCTPQCPASEPAACVLPAAPACPTGVPAQPATLPCKTPTVAKVVNEGESIQLHGTASDYDCNILSTLWQASAGTFDNPTSLDPVYTAPMLSGCSDAEVTVALTAVDGCGSSGTDSFRLLIVNVNHAPTVSAGNDIWIDEGDAIVLQAVGQDADNEGFVVRWAAGGPGSFDDPTVLGAVFHAPLIDLCEGIDIPLVVTVIDPCGASACDTVMVHVRNVNQAPIVDLGPDFSIDEGQTIRWTPSVTDPECDVLRYCWTASAGTFDSTNAVNPLFTVPATFKCAGEPIVVTLTVTDPCGLTATDSVTLQVRNINRAPTVTLESGLCVSEGNTLTLLPQVADPDGDVLRYVWTVSAGRLDSTCVATPVFIAPIIQDCNGIDVTVTLTVTDPCGLTATDSAVIRVQNVNAAPIVVADP